MKIRSIFIFVIVMFVASCGEPDYVREYPLVLSWEITDISAAGVSASAVISDNHFDDITDHGFIWGTTQRPTFPGVFAVRLGKPSSKEFAANIRSGLLENKDYFMRPFLITGNDIVYGLTQQFISKGSEGIIIESVAPLVVIPKEPITITGKRFGTDKTKIKVSFKVNNKPPQPAVVMSLTDTEIVVEAPLLRNNTAKIEVTVEGDKPVESTVSISSKIPTITSMTATTLCNSFDIVGEDLLAWGNPGRIMINGSSVLPIPTLTNTAFTIPASRHAPSIVVRIEYADGPSVSKTLTYPLKWPTVTSITPTSFATSKEFFLTVEDAPPCDPLTVAVTTATIQESEITPTQIRVKLSTIGCGTVRFTVSFRNNVIYTSPTIVPAPFTVTSVTPNEGPPGTVFTVEGTSVDGASIVLNGSLGSPTVGLQFPLTGTSTQATATLPAVYYNEYGIQYNLPVPMLVKKCGTMVSVSTFTLR